MRLSRSHLCHVAACEEFGIFGFHNLVTGLKRWFCPAHRDIGQALWRREQPSLGEPSSGIGP